MGSWRRAIRTNMLQRMVNSLCPWTEPAVRNVSKDAPTAVRYLREISAGVDQFSIPCERIPLVNTQTVGPGVNFIHLFLREQQARQNQGPETPFTTAILGEIEEVNAFARRVMWLRARTIDPTYLSFRQVVY